MEKIYKEIPTHKYIGYFAVWIVLPILIWIVFPSAVDNKVVLLIVLTCYLASRVIYLEDLIEVISNKI